MYVITCDREQAARSDRPYDYIREGTQLRLCIVLPRRPAQAVTVTLTVTRPRVGSDHNLPRVQLSTLQVVIEPDAWASAHVFAISVPQEEVSYAGAAPFVLRATVADPTGEMSGPAQVSTTNEGHELELFRADDDPPGYALSFPSGTTVREGTATAAWLRMLRQPACSGYVQAELVSSPQHGWKSYWSRSKAWVNREQWQRPVRLHLDFAEDIHAAKVARIPVFLRISYLPHRQCSSGTEFWHYGDWRNGFMPYSGDRFYVTQRIPMTYIDNDVPRRRAPLDCGLSVTERSGGVRRTAVVPPRVRDFRTYAWVTTARVGAGTRVIAREKASKGAYFTIPARASSVTTVGRDSGRRVCTDTVRFGAVPRTGWTIPEILPPATWMYPEQRASES